MTVALAAGVLLGATGCTFVTAQGTVNQYNPGNGVATQVGTVKIRDAILLSANGEEASFLVNFINVGEKAVNLHVQYDSTRGKVSSTFHIDAGEVTTFGSKETKQLIFQNIGKKAGTLLPVFFQYGSLSGKQLLVPVLAGTAPEYAGLLPSPTPTATPLSTNPPVPVPIPTAAAK